MKVPLREGVASKMKIPLRGGVGAQRKNSPPWRGGREAPGWFYTKFRKDVKYENKTGHLLHAKSTNGIVGDALHGVFGIFAITRKHLLPLPSIPVKIFVINDSSSASVSV